MVERLVDLPALAFAKQLTRFIHRYADHPRPQTGFRAEGCKVQPDLDENLLHNVV